MKIRRREPPPSGVETPGDSSPLVPERPTSPLDHERPRPVSRRRRVLLGIAAVLCGVLLVLALVLPTIGESYLERTIRDALTRLPGRQVDVAEVDVAWFPTPALVLEGLIVGARDGSELPALRVDQARATVDLLAVGRGEARLRSLRARGVALRLGPSQEPRPKPWDGTIPFAGRKLRVELDDLRIEDLELELVSELALPALHLDRLRLSGGAASPISLSAQGSWLERSFAADARLGTLRELLGGPSSRAHVEVDLSPATVVASGVLRGPFGRSGADLEVSAETPAVEDLLLARRFDLPALGALEARARLQWDGREVALRDLDGTVGESRFGGMVAWTELSVGQRVSAQLVLDPFDARPFAPERRWRRHVREAVVRTGEVDLAELQTTLRDTEIDARLELRTILAPMSGLRDWKLHVVHDSGLASVGFDAWSGRTHGSGIARLGADPVAPVFSIDVEAEGMRLADLVPPDDLPAGLTAEFAHATLHSESEGRTFREIIDRSHLDFGANRGRVTFPLGAEQQGFGVQALRAQGETSGMVHGTLELDYEGEPVAIETEVHGPVAWTTADEHPFTVRAEGLGGIVEAAGKVVGLGQEASVDTELDVAFDDLARLAVLPGLSRLESLELPLEARLAGTVAPRTLAIRAQPLALGRSAANGEVTRIVENGAASYRFALDATRIDLDELRAATEGEEDSTPLLDRPVPADALAALPSLRGTVSVDELAGLDCPLERIRGDLVAERGRISSDGLQLEACGAQVDASFRASSSSDGTGDVVAAQVRLAAHGLRSDRLPMERIAGGWHNSVEGTVAHVEGAAQARGATWRELLDSLEAEVSLGDAKARVRWDPDREPMELAVSSARALHDPAGAWRIDAQVRAGDWPLVLDGSVGGASERRDALPLRVELAGEGGRVLASGALGRPFDTAATQLEVEIALDSLSRPNTALGLALPASAPLDVRTRLRQAGGRLDLEALRLVLGTSQLDGAASWWREEEGPPRFTVDLASAHLRIEDFLPTEPIWTTEEISDDEGAGPKGSTDSTAATAAAEPTRIAWLRAAEGDFRLRFEELSYQGKDHGSGELRSALEEGRIEVEALGLEANADGLERIRLALQDDDPGVAYELELEVIGFDYGELVQKLYPDAPIGLVSLDAKLAGRAARLDELAGATSGHLAAVIAPENVDTELLDLWGASIASTVLRSFQLGQQSHLNCLVLHSELESGVVTANTILLDSTHNRISGSGTADFGAKEFEIQLAPRAKRVTTLSIVTPLRITGWANDVRVRPAMGNWIVRTFRVREWLRARGLWGKRLPPDGTDVCTPSSLHAETLPGQIRKKSPEGAKKEKRNEKQGGRKTGSASSARSTR